MDYGIDIIDETNFYKYSFLIGAIVIIYVVIIIVSIMGPMTSWFENLNKGSINPWFILGLLAFTTIMAYLGLVILYELVPCLNFTPVILFLIGSMLTLMWIVVFYYSQDLVASLWLSSVPFIFMFWVFIYMWYIDPIPSVFVIPLLAVQIYLFYAVAHLASINNVPI